MDCSSSSVSITGPGPKRCQQLLRHAIDAALAAHILAHQDDLAMRQHQVGAEPS
jgi:hypothetical protein